MAQLKRSDVKSVQRAKNGRWFATLRDGKTRFLSEDDAKRLRAGGSTTSQGKGKGKAKAKAKGTTEPQGFKRTKSRAWIGDFY